MIEKFTDEEIKVLIGEIEQYKRNRWKSNKTVILKDEATKIFGGNPFICTDISSSIYRIADYLTDNRILKKNKDNKTYEQISRIVPQEIEDDYRLIIRGILQAITFKYGHKGFGDKEDWDGYL